jgi:hypothetical protein
MWKFPEKIEMGTQEMRMVYIYLKALIAQFHAWNLDFVGFCHLSDFMFSSQDFLSQCLVALLGFLCSFVISLRHTYTYTYTYTYTSLEGASGSLGRIREREKAEKPRPKNCHII